MLGNFFEGVAQLANQNLLYVGFLALVAGGAFMGAKKLAEDRPLYLILVGIWIALAFLVGVANDGGGMKIMFTNPITAALIGAVCGAIQRIYQGLV
jgi:hypothetical protein